MKMKNYADASVLLHVSPQRQLALEAVTVAVCMAEKRPPRLISAVIEKHLPWSTRTCIAATIALLLDKKRLVAHYEDGRVYPAFYAIAEPKGLQAS
jgi:uncharacterized protein YciW